MGFKPTKNYKESTDKFLRGTAYLLLDIKANFQSVAMIPVTGSFRMFK